MTLTVVTWKWRCDGYRTEYDHTHVNALHRQFQRRLHQPHRFVCVTDDPEGVECETIPIWKNPLERPIHPKKPNCYVRLWMFSEEARRLFGDRFVSVDLDAVVTGQLDPLFDVEDDFRIFGYTHPTTPYNGSLWLMRTGMRRHVWDKFQPDKTPELARKSGFCGSDQAVMSYLLGPDEARYTTDDGVYGYRNHFRQEPEKLPKNARIVFFHGRLKPWMEATRNRSPWIRDHAHY